MVVGFDCCCLMDFFYGGINLQINKSKLKHINVSSQTLFYKLEFIQTHISIGCVCILSPLRKRGSRVEDYGASIKAIKLYYCTRFCYVQGKKLQLTSWIKISFYNKWKLKYLMNLILNNKFFLNSLHTTTCQWVSLL